jgi:hypothetical protein
MPRIVRGRPDERLPIRGPGGEHLAHGLPRRRRVGGRRTDQWAWPIVCLCGTKDVAWIHPLASDPVAYREYGKGHTLPTFWALCDRCERIYASGDADAAVEVMRPSDGWSWVADEDVAECIRQPLEVFRHADRGARPLPQ